MDRSESQENELLLEHPYDHCIRLMLKSKKPAASLVLLYCVLCQVGPARSLPVLGEKKE